MTQLMYFIEGRETCSGADLEQLGLGYAFEGGCSSRRCGDGPGGQPGIVVGVSSERLGYWRDQQTWRRLREGSPAIWLGWSTAARPQPADLQRREAIAGHQVRLADGQLWLVPVAFRLEEGTPQRAVPSRMRLDDCGRWITGEVVPRFARLWEIACTWFDSIDPAQAGRSLTIAQAADLCAEALQVNYRISRWELGHLELLDDQGTIAEVLNAVIDWPTYVEWIRLQKKTAIESAAAAG